MGVILFIIGHEATTLPEVFVSLRTAGVQVVVDVRAVPASLRAGL
ncbi:hypothetical protein [Rubellimicrobium roseum]|nr:hypothetical protein [Rubellimicrobium roseum]